MPRTATAIAAIGFVVVTATSCGDRTVTTPRTSARRTPTTVSTGPASGTVANSGASSDATSEDARLAEVDQMLRDVEADMSTADQQASTPEGDPTK